jgi:hypothetical protein
MDVYLTQEADRALEALALLATTPVRGYIIGHRRGPRFYVETVVPAPGVTTLSCDDVLALDRIFGGRTIGFFVLGRAVRSESIRTKPFACGRILLEVESGPGPGTRVKAFAVDYDRRFVLSPVPVKRSRERRKA